MGHAPARACGHAARPAKVACCPARPTPPAAPPRCLRCPAGRHRTQTTVRLSSGGPGVAARAGHGRRWVIQQSDARPGPSSPRVAPGVVRPEPRHPVPGQRHTWLCTATETPTSRPRHTGHESRWGRPASAGLASRRPGAIGRSKTARGSTLPVAAARLVQRPAPRAPSAAPRAWRCRRPRSDRARRRRSGGTQRRSSHAHSSASRGCRGTAAPLTAGARAARALRRVCPGD